MGEHRSRRETRGPDYHRSDVLGTGSDPLQLQLTAAPHQVLAQLDHLALEAEAKKKERSKWGSRALWSFLFLLLGVPIAFLGITFLAAVLGAILESQLPDYELTAAFSLLGVGAGTVFGLFVLVWFIYCLVRRSRVTARNLEPEKLAIARRALELLGRDAKPAAPLHLFVSFAAHTTARAITLPNRAELRRHDWLRIDAVLLDGTRARLVAAIRATERRRSKPRYVKVKRKLVDLVELRLADRRTEELPADAGQRILGRMGYAFPRLTKHRAGPRSLFLRFATSPCVEISGRGSNVTGREQRLEPAKLTAALLRGYRAWAALRRTPPPTGQAPPGAGGAGRGTSGTAMMPVVPG